MIYQTHKPLQTFKLVLQTDKVSPGTIRSYLSDTRHFLGWYAVDCHSMPRHGIYKNYLIDSRIRGNDKGRGNDIGLLNRKTVDRYYDYLIGNQTPRQTFNRRLSSLRKFGAFCVSQGWMKDNYFLYLKNITTSQAIADDRYCLTVYRQSLVAAGNTSQTIKCYLSDIRQFINWISSPSDGFQGDALQDDVNRPNGKASPYNKI